MSSLTGAQRGTNHWFISRLVAAEQMPEIGRKARWQELRLSLETSCHTLVSNTGQLRIFHVALAASNEYPDVVWTPVNINQEL